MLPDPSQYKTVTDLRENTNALLKSLQRQNKPFIVMQNNQPKAAMLTIKHYNHLLNLIEDYKDAQLAAKYEKEFKEEDYVPYEQVVKELELEDSSEDV